MRYITQLGLEVFDAFISCCEGEEVFVPLAVFDVPKIGSTYVANVDGRHLA